METQDRHIIQAGKDTTAFRVIKNLVIVIVFGAIMDGAYPVYFYDTPIWCLISPLLFIAYLGYRVSVNRALEAEAEVYDVSMILQDAEEAESRANAKDLEASAKLEEANAKANASEKIAIEVQTLRASEQTLISKMQPLSADLATARQSLEDAKQAHIEAVQTLKQSHEKAISYIESERDKAIKQAESLDKDLQEIKIAERQAYVKRAFSASKSANKGDLDKVKASMEERARTENEPLFLDFEKYLK